MQPYYSLVFFNLNSRIAARLPAIALAALHLLMVGATAAVISLALETWQLQQPLAIWGWLSASIVIGTCMRFWLQTYAQGFVAASTAAMIMMLEPVWTTVFAMFWFSETMAILQWVGCGLILSSLLVSRWHLLRRALLRV